MIGRYIYLISIMFCIMEIRGGRYFWEVCVLVGDKINMFEVENNYILNYIVMIRYDM